MNPIWGHVAGIITTVLMLLFISIWIWAWRAKHRRVFEQLARLPMSDELEPMPAQRRSQHQHDREPKA